MNLNLTRLSLFLAICLLCASTAMAVPTCSPTTLATLYVSGNGAPPNGFVCDIGTLAFSNFQYSGGLDPLNIHVVPITTPGFEGFDFTGTWGVGKTGQPLSDDVNIKFTVTATVGQLTDIHIDLNNVNATGTGLVNYTEQFCKLDGTCQIFVDKPGTNLTTDILLANSALGGPQTSINISKDLQLTVGKDQNGNATGTANMSDFDNYYSHTVPEPRAVSIVLALGLLGVVAFMKRRQVVRS